MSLHVLFVVLAVTSSDIITITTATNTTASMQQYRADGGVMIAFDHRVAFTFS
jgi:hypothetical protein